MTSGPFCHLPRTTEAVFEGVISFSMRPSLTLISIESLEMIPSIPVNETLNLFSGKIKPISSPKSKILIPFVLTFLLSSSFLFTKNSSSISFNNSVKSCLCFILIGSYNFNEESSFSENEISVSCILVFSPS